MLRVLRHYLPLRKALLIGSETLLLTAVLAAWTTAHLWTATSEVEALLFARIPALSVEDAILRCVSSSLLLAILSQIAISFNELYDVRVFGSRYERASRFVESAGSALALALLATVVTHVWELRAILDFPPLSLSQRVQTLVFAMLSGFALLYLWRGFYGEALRRVRFGERTLILGAGRAAQTLARQILEREDAGILLVGMVPDAWATASRRDVVPETRHAWLHSEQGAPRLRAVKAGETHGSAALAQAGDTAPAAQAIDLLWPEGFPPPAHIAARRADTAAQSLWELVQRERIDLLIVALEDRRNSLPIEDLLRCRLEGIPVREQESVYEQVTGKIAVEALRPSYLIFNEGFSRHPWTELGKRLCDLAFASILLVLTWPLMLATAIAVRFDSPGPVLFAQERVGRDGRSFTLLKFRSMRADAEKHTGPVWATQDDPRITRSGRFMRKTRLDELPQLFNVLAGHMSLVGPRPERPHFVEDLAQKIPYFRQRHIVKPGLTGWAQINYRYGSTFEDAVQKLQYDLFYIKNQSLLFDVSILFNTIKIVLLRKGT